MLILYYHASLYDINDINDVNDVNDVDRDMRSSLFNAEFNCVAAAGRQSTIRILNYGILSLA